MSANGHPVSIEEKVASSAAEFWELLCPENPLFPLPCQLLYRGQADASKKLVPSILRDPENKLGVLINDGVVASDFQVFKEWIYLKSFVDHCDSIGLRIPNDSGDFRALFLDQNAPGGPGRAFIQTSLWPDPTLYELLALAQHHGIPTRLLDWSTRSYVAAYFAISGALRKTPSQTGGNGQPERGSDRLAVWVLNITRKSLYPLLETIRVPGGNSAYLAAQGGMFTLLRQQGGRGKPFEGESSLDQYLLQQELPVPLVKITLPVSEAKAALRLCAIYGVTGATLFPDYSGAARASIDLMLTSIFDYRGDARRSGIKP
jgi:hypothetical protein